MTPYPGTARPFSNSNFRTTHSSTYMNAFRSLFSSARTAMPKQYKTPPPPTVPTAIKGREDAVPGDGEHLFSKYFGNLPQFKAVVGYTGGAVESPSYRQVCTGATNHAEAVQLTYQKGSVSYAELVEFFYRTHDPTTLNSQGPDRGTQYRSAIYYHTLEQEKIAKAVTSEVQDKYFKDRKIVTEIAPAGKWWNAEDYHQQYLDNNPGGYECPTHMMYW